MTPNPTVTEGELSDALLNKADALIRRNRPDGVGLESEELPLLTEIVDDLPELTDTLVVGRPDTLMREERSSFSFDLGYDERPEPLTSPTGTSFGRVESAAYPPPPAAAEPTAPASLSREQVDLLIEDAIQRTRDELLRRQGDAIHDTAERTRRELAASHAQQLEQLRREHQAQLQRAVQEATEGVRAENRAMQARAVQAALEQGREEGLASQATYLNDVRQEAAELATMQISEHLIQLDAYIAQAIDGWLAQELPQIIAGELDSLVERLRMQTAAHMRATLLPEISDKLSSILDATLDRPR